MVQWVKELAVQACQPELEPQNPHKGGRTDSQILWVPQAFILSLIKQETGEAGGSLGV